MTQSEQRLDASGLRVAIVAARFHTEITQRLVLGARECLAELGATDVTLDWVPGAFELPLASRLRIEAGADAIVALGCVVRGETPHFEFVAREAARGIMIASLETGVPVAFGVLTTEDMPQAEARAGGDQGNKGRDAAATAVEMALLARNVVAAGDGHGLVC
ncbi:MAG: 6,7-dimethyl-8-ribityllumazine synthase [Actinomycetota bacterium]